jgi:hypothetical protein
MTQGRVGLVAVALVELHLPLLLLEHQIPEVEAAVVVMVAFHQMLLGLTAVQVS